MIVEELPERVREHVRNARRNGMRVGCVPTMGALHQGHCSLMERARRECDFVVSTIFVNPTQFLPGEDFTRYPRTLEADLRCCADSGADLVFTPQTEHMYAENAQTTVQPGKLAEVLEGVIRPGHFAGVTTIVAKLFAVTEPDVAYFGQKDFQQQLIIRQMVRDLKLPVEIVTCPIVRELDGLAMSSRNRYLSAAERDAAVELSRALAEASRLATESSLSSEEISEQMRNILQSSGQLEVQYAVLADPETLEYPLGRTSGGEAVGLIAVRLGTTRLIDNALIRFS